MPGNAGNACGMLKRVGALGIDGVGKHPGNRQRIGGIELNRLAATQVIFDLIFNIGRVHRQPEGFALRCPAKSINQHRREQVAAKTRDDLTFATMALDRLLRAERFWVPQWYKASHTVAYYDMFNHPEALPDYALGEMDFWWYDAEKAARLKAEGAIR